MKDAGRAEKFLRDADALLHGETPVTDDADERALLVLARDLITADFSAETDLDALRPAALRANVKGKNRMSRRARLLLTAAAVVSLVAAAFLTVPPLRAFAQEILRQIGVYNITDEETYYERQMNPFPVLNLLDPAASREVDELDPFWPVQPSVIPAGFALTGYELVNIEGDRYFQFARSNYVSVAQPDIRFSVNQMMKHDVLLLDFETGGGSKENAIVRGTPAVWVEGFREHPEIETQQLFWEISNVRVWVESEGLSRDEVLEIADLVQPHYRRIRQPEDQVPLILGPVSATAMAVEIGLPVAVIRDIPSGYELIARSGTNNETLAAVRSDYTNRLDLSGPTLLSFSQELRKDETAMQWQFAVGDAPVEDVTVNGNPGVWIEDTYANSSLMHDVLIWTQNGYTLRLQASAIARDEMFRMAGSVEFIDADTGGEPDEPTQESVFDDFVTTRFVPEYLPDGFELLRQEDVMTGEGMTVLSLFVTQDGSDMFSIHQMLKPSGTTARDLVPEGTTAEDVTVNVWRGIWSEDFPSYGTPVRTVIWQQYAYTMQIKSVTLSRDEMLRIAESMRGLAAD